MLRKKQHQKTQLSGSSATNTASFASAQTASPPSCLLHRSCKTLKIGAFISAYCNNDLSVLVIDGTPTDQELKDAWDEILFEYSTLIRNGDSAYLLGLQKRISLLDFDIFYSETAVGFLKQRFDQDIIDYLINELGYFGDYNPENPDQYERQLNRILSLVKTKKEDLKDLISEYERLNNTNTGKKQSEEDFGITLAALSKYINYRLDKQTVCVDEFASVFTLYLTERDHQEKNSKPNG